MATFLLPFHPFRRRNKPENSPEGHILILGFGSAGMWTVKPFMAQGDRVLVVDHDAVVCGELEKRNIPYLRGDGAEPDVLDKAGASSARLIVASMRRVGDALTVLKRAKEVPAIVRVFEESDAEMIRNAGGIPVMNSMAAADTFMEWIDANNQVKV